MQAIQVTTCASACPKRTHTPVKLPGVHGNDTWFLELDRGVDTVEPALPARMSS